jgi:UDP-2-acetamido-3-amino-2,3-dideoxy-glucuronate N-acetyltransferase
MNTKETYISTSALIGAGVVIEDGVKIWGFTHIREHVRIGHSTIIGEQVYIGSGVTIGANCKIQNRAMIYEPAVIEDGVFIGPGVIITNDKNPRSITTKYLLKTTADWKTSRVHVQNGASLGAGTVCIAPIVIGNWAMTGAGSIVTKDVLDFSLVVGSPAKQIGWVGRSGFRLKKENDSLFICPVTSERYLLSKGKMQLENKS